MEQTLNERETENSVFKTASEFVDNEQHYLQCSADKPADAFAALFFSLEFSG